MTEPQRFDAAAYAGAVMGRDEDGEYRLSVMLTDKDGGKLLLSLAPETAANFAKELARKAEDTKDASTLLNLSEEILGKFGER